MPSWQKLAEMKKESIKASEFDKKFDEGNSIIEYLDLAQIKKPANQPKRVSVDFPEWMVNELDKESQRLGVIRQSIIKIYISDKLKELKFYELTTSSGFVIPKQWLRICNPFRARPTSLIFDW